MNKYRYLFLILYILVLPLLRSNTQVLFVKTGSTINLSPNAIMAVNGGVQIQSGASIVHRPGISQSYLYLAGTWNNLGSYTHNNNGRLTFMSNRSDTIKGSATQTFYNLWINKNDTTKMLNMAKGVNAVILKDLRMVTNNIFNVDSSDLTIETTGMIYADTISNYSNELLVDPFNDYKHISLSGKLLGGTLTKKYSNLGNISNDKIIRFMVGTPNDTNNPTSRYYTPARFVFASNMATFASNNFITIRPINREHPAVQVSGVSLRKYWTITSSNITPLVNGYSTRFDYNVNEVQGNELMYSYCLFYRSNTFFVNPGTDGYGVEPINHRFRVDAVNQQFSSGNVLIDGDWTVGQVSAVNNIYYSRQSGDFNNPNTWSHISHTGVAAANYPQSLNAVVIIGNGHTVSDSIGTSNLLSVTVKANSKLDFTKGSTSYLLADTFDLQDYATLGLSDPNGITSIGLTGNVRTNYQRNFSEKGIYIYKGASNQVTGSGLPATVGALVIDGGAAVTISLSNSVNLRDSLVINNSIFNLFQNGSFTANGESTDTTNRVLIMRGGELACQNFPTNYKTPYFTIGSITFGGSGSVNIPSNLNSIAYQPKVDQYYNLKLSGTRASNTYITFNSDGEIRVSGNLDISGLTFQTPPVAERFVVTGSTVNFNSSAGTQNISTGYATAQPLIYRLKFDNLKITGAGIKSLQNPNDVSSSDNSILVMGNLNLISGTLLANNYNIKVQRNWVTTAGAFFTPGTDTVFMESQGLTNTITSNGVTFYNLVIKGTSNGNVDLLDNLTANGNITIQTANMRLQNSVTATAMTNFTNTGTFTSNTGTILFGGTGTIQTLVHSGNGTFYNINVNKSTGNVYIDGDSLIKVTNQLTLTKGNIGGRYSQSVSNKPIRVEGTISRPGATPGHIDGRLRLPTTEDAFTQTFPVGVYSSYLPMQIDVAGSGGAAGYLDGWVINDTATAASSVNLNSGILGTDIPNGAMIDITKYVKRYWVLAADQTSTPKFALGSDRSYNLTLNFNAGDVLGNFQNYEIRQRDDNTNNTGRWSRPIPGTRNSLNTNFLGDKIFTNTNNQYFVVGEPSVFFFYSIANGNFNNANTWSTASYANAQVASRAPGLNDNVYIGDGKTVTLTANYAINGSRTLIVEKKGPSGLEGRLNTSTFQVSGTGTFRLDSGATLDIGSSAGITTAGATGNIITTTRQYNGQYSHNYGNFIYSASANCTAGDGLPLTMNTLTVNLGSTANTLRMSTSLKAFQVRDSLMISNGTCNSADVVMKIGGNLIVGATGTFNTGNTEYGSNPTELTDSASTASGLLFNGYNNIQEIKSTRDPLFFQRLSLKKPGGALISQTNIQVSQVYFYGSNRANFDFRTYNKWLMIYSSGGYAFYRGTPSDSTRQWLPNPLFGYVDGKLLRWFGVANDNRIFPIGSTTRYSPVALILTTAAATTGLVEVIVTDGNHPKFNSNGTQIKPSSNIQKYWEINVPVISGYTSVSLGAVTLQTRLMYYDDDIRGGASPSTNYFAFRKRSNSASAALRSQWVMRNDTISVSTRTNNAWGYETFTNINTPNARTANGIFVDTSITSSARTITLMVGDTSSAVIRYFYSRVPSGNWTTNATWSSTGYNGVAASAFPSQNNNATNDIVFIGDTLGESRTVIVDAGNVTATEVNVLRNGTGASWGTLSCPLERYVSCNQFVMKNGAQLEIGSSVGIVPDPGTTGNIRASVTSNYNFGQQNKNKFVYIGTGNQVTGAGLPAGKHPTFNVPVGVGMLEIRNTGVANKTVSLTDSVWVIDSLKLSSGILSYSTNKEVSLSGDLINNINPNGSTALAVSAGTPDFNFSDTNAVQLIRGSADTTAFPSILKIYKTKGLVRDTSHHILARANINFALPAVFELGDNKTFTLGSTALFTTTGAWDTTKLVKISGGPNTGVLNKIFPNGSNITSTVMFPIGDDSLKLRRTRFDSTVVTITGMQTVNANNILSITLRANYPHPSFTSGTPSMLKKYWRMNTTGITRGTGTTSLRLMYDDAEVVGNILRYYPALYRRSDIEPNGVGWSFNLFSPTAKSIDTTNKFIIVDNAQTLPYHDWSAGDPSSFNLGRAFWSIATGNWSNPLSWTNDSINKHTSTVTALNPPGFYSNDTVHIGNNNVISFDQTPSNYIDSLSIGLTASNGELQFLSSTGSNKSLTIKKSLIIGNTGVNSGGLLSKQNTAAVTSNDTLLIWQNLKNDATFNLKGVTTKASGNNNQVLFKFISDSNSAISGNGLFNSVGSLILSKNSISDTLFNLSSNYCTALATAITTNTTSSVSLNTGVYYHDVNSNTTFSRDGGGAFYLSQNVAMYMKQGKVIFLDTLVSQQNSYIYLNGGNLDVGNAINEGLFYENSVIDIRSTSTLSIAGNFRRRFSSSLVNLSVSGTSLIEVNKTGTTTNTTDRRGTFDIGNSLSTFSMSSGIIKISRPMTLNSGLKDPDYNVQADNFSITGGTVQIGDSTLGLTIPVNTNFSILTSVPFWNLDVNSTYNTVNSNGDLLFSGAVTTILNNFNIRRTGTSSLNGQDIRIGGDLVIDGLFKTGSSGTRRVTFFGNPSDIPATSLTQNLKIRATGSDNFYDISISKASGGSLLLSNDDVNYPQSNLIISNSLQFTSSNTALIDASTNRYVQLGTNATDLASSQRNGLGHVVGEFRQWINRGAQLLDIPIGTSTHYTPATFQSSSSTNSGTAGLLSFRAYGVMHPDSVNASSLIDLSTTISRYWKIDTSGITTKYSLGNAGNYNLTLQYIKGTYPTGDVKSGALASTFELFYRIPTWPTTPATWNSTTPDTRTDTTTNALALTSFGDFVIANPAGNVFYSINNGDWGSASTWSNTSYVGTSSGLVPSQGGDRVNIGNGKTVILSSSNPRIRSVIVEKYQNVPGTLQFINDRYLRATSFDLKDSCTIITDDVFGFNSLTGPFPNVGSIRTTSARNYGLGRFIYTGSNNQSVGDGPTNAKALITINPTSNIIVSLSNNGMNVQDSLTVTNGLLSLNNNNLFLTGQFVIEAPARFTGDPGTLTTTGTGNQYFVFNNTNGDTVANLVVNKPSGDIIITGTAPSGDLSILNTLTFSAPNTAVIDARTNSRKVVLLNNNTTLTRTGLGHIDGILQRPFLTGAETFKFDIGYGKTYMPVTTQFTAGAGTAGMVRGSVDTLVLANVPPRMSKTKKVNYYWTLNPTGTFAIGTRTLNTTVQFPSAQLLNLAGGVPNANTLMKRKVLPAGVPLWYLLTYPQITFNSGIATATITNSADYWNGLGEIYIGDKGLSVFYSLKTGNWTDNNSWTYDPSHTGTPVDPGDYPNPSSDLNQDVAYIGLNHNIIENQATLQLDTLIIRHGGILDVGLNVINCPTCNISKGLFAIQDSGTIRFGGTNTPVITSNLSNFINYSISPNSYTEYYGTQTLPSNPYGNTEYLGNVIVSNPGTKNINTPVIVNGNFYVTTGANLLLSTGANILTVKKNLISSSSINNCGIIEIGQ